ncbi:MAG: ribbon-helix-helix domain-containing protein [Candidatus Methanomethylophilaceae archaeon]|jgi:metal-responsive CopG/Arc/MetJ family transcriptional regulator
MDGERITLRMESEDVQVMDEFLQSHPEISNRSQLIRVALRNYMERDAPLERGNTLSIRLGERFMGSLTKLSNGGMAESEEEVAKRIIERFLMPQDIFEDAAKEAFKAYDSYAEIAKR